MSYFEDNKDRIIYGPKLSELGKRHNDSRPYYTKKDGTRQYLDEMSNSHLSNALALAERKNLRWYINIFRKEIARRQCNEQEIQSL